MYVRVEVKFQSGLHASTDQRLIVQLPSNAVKAIDEKCEQAFNVTLGCIVQAANWLASPLTILEAKPTDRYSSTSSYTLTP